MSRKLALVLAIGLAPLVARAEDKENPFKNAKKGDWVSYKTKAQFGDFKSEGTMKQTVTDKDDKSVTLKIATNFMGMDLPAQEQKIDLTKPFDPSSSAVPGGKAKVEKMESGKETIEVDGKKYECEWVKSKVTVEANGMKIESESKVWMSKQAPLSGMVKMESKLQQGSMTVELSGSGGDK